MRPGAADAVRARRLALVGAAAIAVSFGLARFALGLFLPELRSELSLDPARAGLVAAVPFLSFCVASLVAAPVTARLGPRRSAALAMLAGGAGLAAMAGAAAMPGLVAGAALCGLCTGWSMPALTEATRVRVPDALRGRTEAVMNAGTSVGVALSTPALLLLASWRDAYLLFAGAALLAVPALVASLPAQGVAPKAPTGGSPTDASRAMLRRASAMGLCSAGFWSFAPDLAAQAPGSGGAWLWLAVGLGGLAGGAAGDLVDRIGVRGTHALGAVLLALSIGSFPWLAAAPVGAALAAGAFGVAYMALTSLHLLTGTRLHPERPARGAAHPFLAIAFGQAIGAGVSGVLVGELGHGPTLALGAVGAAGLAASSRGCPEPRPA
ncbi:MAG: MFS transporter [Pseudomonadales bacterium]|jgi:predicted MFS family arabinose efflux permease|nr:MFS transporter [Pseudomonadales bacterium]